MEYIPVEELKVGAYYKVKARNFRIAKWNGQYFRGIRHKFAWVFLDKEWHWDEKVQGLGIPGTVKPIEKIGL